MAGHPRDLDPQDLLGRTIVRWAAVEMALKEAGPDGLPLFDDEDLPLIQLVMAQINFFGAEPLDIMTSQDDDTWGLSLQSSTEPLADAPHWYGIYRHTHYLDLPYGLVEEVHEVRDERHNLIEIWLTVGDSSLMLAPGEVHERLSGSYELAWGDESIFAISPASLASTLPDYPR